MAFISGMVSLAVRVLSLRWSSENYTLVSIALGMFWHYFLVSPIEQCWRLFHEPSHRWREAMSVKAVSALCCNSGGDYLNDQLARETWRYMVSGLTSSDQRHSYD